MSPRYPLLILMTACLLLIAFGIALFDLQTDSLWNDEAWSVWAVSAPTLGESLERIRADVHPPLYFLFLYGWMRVTGESALALRLLSVWFGLIGLAATYAVGKRLFDRWTGIIALALLGASGFFIYYAREARMYTLLLALAALSTWAYLLWRGKPTSQRVGLYGLLMTGMLYTHYSGGLVILTHLIHLVVTWRENTATQHRLSLRNAWIPYAIAGLLFLPWMPIFLNQMRANPDGPLAIPVPTDWGTVAGLVLVLTAGSWGLFIVPFVLGSAVPRLRQYWRQVLLLMIWLLLTPVVLLALNAWLAPVYQVRYAIAMLPAGALLLAYGLRWVGLPFGSRIPILGGGTRYIVSLLMVLGLLVLFAHSQWTLYWQLWPGKPPWEQVISAMIAARNPLDLTITDLAPYSPSAYYDRQLGIRQGESLDLSWRLHNGEEISSLMGRFDETPSVWVALPINTAKTWHIVAHLDKTRGIGYRDALVNMIFYQFDANLNGDLDFRFEDWLRVQAAQGAGEQLTTSPGETLCTELALETLKPLDGSYSAGLHLVDITGTKSWAQWDMGLGTGAAGETLHLSPCMHIPPDVPPGDYHLELVIYEWVNQKRLWLFEDSQQPPKWWGDVLMLAAVKVL
jgi:4-amino-4-deoxy-L-arabinose transferase-like glycosyltransferase